MAEQDRRLDKAVWDMTPEHRLRQWLSLMREAGGLRFERASQAQRRVLRNLQLDLFNDTTFHEAQERVLVMNRLCGYVFETEWKEAYHGLSKIASLLALSVMVEEKTLNRRLLQKARPGARPRRGASLEAPDLLYEYARYMGLVLTADTDLNAYWSELLGTQRTPEAQDPSLLAQLGSLLQQDADGYMRPLQRYVYLLRLNLTQPVHVFDLVTRTYGPLPGIESAECMLPPLQEYRQRNELILAILRDSPWTATSPEIVMSEPEETEIRRALVDPSGAITDFVDRYYAWLDKCPG